MKRFVTGQARGQATLFPERLEDFVGEDNPVRVIDAFVEQLELRELGFAAVDPKAGYSTQTGHPFQRKLDTRSRATWTVGAKRRAG